MGSTVQIGELFAEGVHRLYPASYVTAGSHDTFELNVRTHGTSLPS